MFLMDIYSKKSFPRESVKLNTKKNSDQNGKLLVCFLWQRVCCFFVAAYSV